MQPKKRILLMGGDELQRSCLACPLDTNGFAVMNVEGPADPVIRALKLPDVILVIWPVGIKKLNILRTALCRKTGADVPVVALASEGEITEAERVKGYAIVRPDTSMAQLLEVLKVASRRKRGPKPGYREYLKTQGAA